MFIGAVVRICHLLHRPRSKKTGRARRPCRAELVDLYAQSVPAQRPAPTNFHRALCVIGHVLAIAYELLVCPMRQLGVPNAHAIVGF